jgi:hypothetical protein
MSSDDNMENLAILSEIFKDEFIPEEEVSYLEAHQSNCLFPFLTDDLTLVAPSYDGGTIAHVNIVATPDAGTIATRLRLRMLSPTAYIGIGNNCYNNNMFLSPSPSPRKKFTYDL